MFPLPGRKGAPAVSPLPHGSFEEKQLSVMLPRRDTFTLISYQKSTRERKSRSGYLLSQTSTWLPKRDRAGLKQTTHTRPIAKKKKKHHKPNKQNNQPHQKKKSHFRWSLSHQTLKLKAPWSRNGHLEHLYCLGGAAKKIIIHFTQHPPGTQEGKLKTGFQAIPYPLCPAALLQNQVRSTDLWGRRNQPTLIFIQTNPGFSAALVGKEKVSSPRSSSWGLAGLLSHTARE